MTERGEERIEQGDDGTVDGVPTAALPADLVRVIDWLRGHLAEPIDLERLAAVAGVRPRTLEAHFRSFLGTTPLGWMRRMRLVNARRELERGRAHARVTDIALANGFNQLGRFAADYRSVFGEAPSVTLRRGRGGSRHASNEPIDDEAFRLTWKAMPHVFAIAPRQCSEALQTLQKAQQLAPDYGLPVALAAFARGNCEHIRHGLPRQAESLVVDWLGAAAA